MAQAQTPSPVLLSATSLPQCHTLPPPIAPASSTSSSAGVAAQFVVDGSSCQEFPEYAPAFYAANGLPAIPIKTVRVMFHVFQRHDGTGNWQSLAQDGGADERVLRGLLNGLRFPDATSPLARGVNGIYAGLDNLLTTVNSAPAAAPVRAAAPYNDTRIRFDLTSIRYYRTDRFWNMSDNSVDGCNG